MPVRQGHELTEWVMLGYIIEDKVFADIASNCIQMLVSRWCCKKKAREAHSRTGTSSKPNPRLVSEGL